MSESSTARSVALGVLMRVVNHGGYSNIALRSALSRSGLSGADRDLATELTYGTLRRLLFLDWALAPLLARPLERTPPRALALLRLGAYQLLFTRIPSHAAVSETVGQGSAHERGFLNAVLRRLAVERPEIPQGDGPAEVSIRTGMAEWAVRELHELLGNEAVEAAGALATRAPLTLRVNTSLTTVEDLERAISRAGARVSRGRIRGDSLVVGSGSPEELPGFREGWFAVQDEASSFVVEALDPQPGDVVLDACAGPGGKAGHIAALVRPGGKAVAGDSHPGRAALVRAAASRLRLRPLVLSQDARRPALKGPFHRVLVDAPCSGIGSARRRPELLWRPRAEDLPGLAALQSDIAASSAELLAPGGRLIYSVCTFPTAETDAVCEELLRRVPSLESVPVGGPDGSGERVRLWPHRHGTDAMFVAAFRRRTGSGGLGGG